MTASDWQDAGGRQVHGAVIDERVIDVVKYG